MSKFCCHTAGFHLLEILIALAIIAISSQWMMENYQQFIAAERRREAQQALYNLAGALEEYAFVNTGYSGATLHKLKIKHLVAHKTYELKIINAHKNFFLISAKPQEPQAKHDKTCGTLYLRSSGEKYAAGSDKSCWI